MDALQKLTEQVTGDESQAKSVLRQLDELVKASAKELQQNLPALLNGMFPDDLQLRHNPEHQMELLNGMKTRFAAQELSCSATQLYLVTGIKLQIKLNGSQRFAALCYLFLQHSGAALHRLALQLLLKSTPSAELPGMVFVVLQYFTMAAQQGASVFVLLCGELLSYFVQQGNLYAGYEFLKRNKAKLNALSRMAMDVELRVYYVNASLILASSGQVEQAAQLIRQARALSDDVKARQLELVYRVLSLQELQDTDDTNGATPEGRYFSVLKDFYLGGQLRYNKQAEFGELCRATEEAEAWLRQERLFGLAVQILAPAFQAKLRLQFLAKVYTEAPPFEMEGVNAMDFHAQCGVLKFQQGNNFYQTPRPRQLLLEVLEKKVEAQRLAGLRNVQGEEFEDEGQSEEELFGFEDFLDFFYEGSD